MDFRKKITARKKFSKAEVVAFEVKLGEIKKRESIEPVVGFILALKTSLPLNRLY
ncbi:MAG: hypothetical protein GY757_57365 [bacterium]|nr:hypothetical protein [bacterium]